MSRQILPMVDVQTQAELKGEIGALQDAWEQSNGLVVKKKALSEAVIQVCNQNLTHCSLGICIIFDYVVIQTYVD